MPLMSGLNITIDVNVLHLNKVLSLVHYISVSANHVAGGGI